MEKQNLNNFLKITGTVFGIVGILHLYRAISSWTLIVEGFTIPVWLSFVAGILILGMSYLAFKLSKK